MLFLSSNGTSVLRGGARGACTPLSFRTPLFFRTPPRGGVRKKIGGSPLLFCCPLVFQTPSPTMYDCCLILIFMPYGLFILVFFFLINKHFLYIFNGRFTKERRKKKIKGGSRFIFRGEGVIWLFQEFLEGGGENVWNGRRRGYKGCRCIAWTI